MRLVTVESRSFVLQRRGACAAPGHRQCHRPLIRRVRTFTPHGAESPLPYVAGTPGPGTAFCRCANLAGRPIRGGRLRRSPSPESATRGNVRGAHDVPLRSTATSAWATSFCAAEPGLTIARRGSSKTAPPLRGVRRLDLRRHLGGDATVLLAPTLRVVKTSLRPALFGSRPSNALAQPRPVSARFDDRRDWGAAFALQFCSVAIYLPSLALPKSNRLASQAGKRRCPAELGQHRLAVGPLKNGCNVAPLGGMMGHHRPTAPARIERADSRRVRRSGQHLVRHLLFARRPRPLVPSTVTELSNLTGLLESCSQPDAN